MDRAALPTTPTPMYLQSLHGSWQFKQAGTDQWLPATIPGTVHTDLLALNRIPDPFVGDNEKQVQWVAQTDWEYQHTFSVEPSLLNQPHIFLVCKGLDTLTDVSLNGNPLGNTDNMFRAYRWDVTSLLKAGENQLTILFRSNVNYCDERWKARPLIDVGDFSIRGGAYLRKAPCHFGWDWGPMLPTAGVWKDIQLEAYSAAKLEDVHLRQVHENGEVKLSVNVITTVWDKVPLTARLTVRHPNGHTQSVETALSNATGSLELKISDPQLWWPNGYGQQPLYQVEVSLKHGDEILDTHNYQVGLRTLELRQTPDQWGRSFTFVVNGVPIFAKGSNWIPADSFPTRLTPAFVETLIASAAATHQNMLRIWGGGYYEYEYFYDLCDRYGILVWQDFMFACAAYPMYEAAFIENVKEEAFQNIRRLRHRACLALWCGNNEIEGGWVGWGWTREDTQDLKQAYDQFFHKTLPQWVQAEDPDTAYWPSSPSSDTPFQDPNGDAIGDVHQWSVWHEIKPFSNYRSTFARFVSEFGFQSLPALETVATYAEPADWNMTSYIMEHHQRNTGGNGRIIAYLTQHFRLPKDFPTLVYLTQVLQAEAMRIGVEHWRRIRERNSGTLYWQLNDCWPVASWSSIDYFGRWKALQYAAKHFYAPVHLSVEDNGPQLALCVTNDTTDAWQGEVHWRLETLNGQKLTSGASGTEAVSAQPLATTQIAAFDFAAQLAKLNNREVVFITELHNAQGRQLLTVTPFVPNKHLALSDPQLKINVEQKGGDLAITVQAQSLARFVQLSLDGADVIFSDNFFDVPASEPITVTCPVPSGWALDKARAALKATSLRDTYA